MKEFRASAKSGFTAGANFAGDAKFAAVAENYYRIECREYAGGPVLWVEEIANLVTTQGLDNALTNQFKGVAYTAAWFVGLVDAAGFVAFAAGDTAAQIGGSNQWAELQAFVAGTRPALVLGTAAAGSVDNTASLAVFVMNASGTIQGAFVASSSTKGGTGGALYGEGAFPTPQPFISGNVISVTATLTLASA